VLLFDPAGKLMMAGQSVERLLGKPAMKFSPPTGRSVSEHHVLGSLVLGAVQRRESLQDQVVNVDAENQAGLNWWSAWRSCGNPRGSQEIGTLVTLRMPKAADSSSCNWMSPPGLRPLAASPEEWRMRSRTAEPRWPAPGVLKGKLDAAEPEIESDRERDQAAGPVVKTFLTSTSRGTAPQAGGSQRITARRGCVYRPTPRPTECKWKRSSPGRRRWAAMPIFSPPRRNRYRHPDQHRAFLPPPVRKAGGRRGHGLQSVHNDISKPV